MAAKSMSNARKMPKGGRKGGSVFPRVKLDAAVAYARKLVSKTHVAAQTQDVIYSGVVGAKSGTGNIRMSALKQYGFMIGDTKSLYSAGDLAKKIHSAPDEELISLYREAVLKPNVFKKLFETFHGDSVSKARLKQRAADLKVHPDETATCIDIYLSGLQLAQLVTIEGDQVNHISMRDLGDLIEGDSVLETSDMSQAEEDGDSVDSQVAVVEYDQSEAIVPQKRDEGIENINDPSGASKLGPRAVFNVNISLDSSLDIEKLQKQLELLKKFGAI